MADDLLPENKANPLAAAPLPLRPSTPPTVAEYIRESILRPLPNDLTANIYLASLRDCNSGAYLHPQLSHKYSVEEADRELRICHEEVFRRLLKTNMASYVLQFNEYIRYTRADRDMVLRTWTTLQAYRATVPLTALSVFTELFCLNIRVALAILTARNAGAPS
jgi:hypothetical protein